MAFFIAAKSPGQDTMTMYNPYPAGISIEYGTGRYALRDEYISQEKYTGSIPYLSLGWARKHDNYIYRLHLEYRNSDDIKNYNMASDITQFTLHQGFLYPLKKRELFNRHLNLWLGPTADLFFFYNNQKVAVDGFDYTQSFAALLSAGIDLAGVYSLNSDFRIESYLALTALSLGFRMVDDEEDNQSPAKLLSLFSGLNASFDLGIRYYLFQKLSVKAGYRFELCRINAWNPLLTTSDNVLIGLTYDF